MCPLYSAEKKTKVMNNNCDNISFYFSIDLPLLESFILSRGFESLSRALWFHFDGLALALDGRTRGRELHQLLSVSECLNFSVISKDSIAGSSILG